MGKETVIMEDKLQAKVVGTRIELNRFQWKGNSAYISNYPGLLEYIQQYTWTYANGYLRCSKLNKYLHWTVLAFLYSAEKLDTMLENSNIIEHLDNNGLNCCYDNLHVLSSDYNKAKAFTIDKAQKQILPVYITDVFFDHEKSYYQMQITFNSDMYWNMSTHIPIEAFFAQYSKFEDLYLDWLYVIQSKGSFFDIQKFHYVNLYAKDSPLIQLKSGEEDSVIIERDGEYYLRLSLEPGNRFACIKKTSYRKIGQ